MATPFIYFAALAVTVVSLPMGLWLIALSIKRGEIRETHGSWDRLIKLKTCPVSGQVPAP